MNTLEIYWQNPKSRERSLVGFLTKEETGFKFKYSLDVIDGKVDNFKPIYPFLDYEKEYSSKTMFSNFSNRIPDSRRNDIKNILKKYNLDRYDEFDLLAKSGGRTPADNLEFICPIDVTAKTIERSFYIAGVSHGEFCSGRCEDFCLLNLKNCKIELCEEPDNQYDEYAIKLLVSRRKIGYIPKYYSKSVSQLIKNGYAINIYFDQINQKDSNCRECIKAILKASK